MQIAKLFVNGSSQAVRLPKEFRFEGNEVYAYKIGDTVMLVPKEKAWSTFLEGINEFTEIKEYIFFIFSFLDSCLWCRV